MRAYAIEAERMERRDERRWPSEGKKGANWDEDERGREGKKKTAEKAAHLA